MKISELMKAAPVDAKFDSDPFAWLNALSEQQRFQYLLAHSDDALVWGEWRDKQLWLAKAQNDKLQVADSQGNFGAQSALFAPTLQQLRMFDTRGELLIWRTDDGFMQRWIQDPTPSKADALPDEINLLWGNKVVEQANGFSLLAEGQQGLMHAPPLLGLKPGERAALLVRHYVDDSATNGKTRIGLSRAVDLKCVAEVRNDC